MNFIFTALVISCCFIAVINCKGIHYTTTDGMIFYASYPEKANWFQALRSCLLRQMNLIDVDSSKENARIKETIQAVETKYDVKKTQWWTSGTNLGTEGAFFWATTGYDLTYTDWSDNEPNNKGGDEHCLHFNWKKQWNDNTCDFQIYYMCRFK